MKHFKIYLLFLLFIAASTILFSQNPAATWQVTFGGEQFNGLKPKDCPIEYSHGLVKIKDGSYVVAGRTENCAKDTTGLVKEKKYSDTWIANISTDGAPVWFKYLFFDKPVQFEGYSNEVRQAQDEVFRGRKIMIATSDSGFLTGGSVGSANYNKKAVLIKHNSKGAVEWEKIIEAKEFCDGDCAKEDPYLFHIQEQPDGMILGLADINYKDKKSILLVKFNRDGDIKKSIYLPDLSFTPNYAVPSGDGGLIISIKNSNLSGEEKQNDVNLLKFAENGSPVWKKNFGKPGIEEEVFSMTKSEDGGFIIGANISGKNSSWIFKVDSNGEKLWENQFDKPDQFVDGLVETPEKDIIAILSQGEGPFYMVKYKGTDGKKIWEKKHSRRSYAIAMGGITRATGDGYVILAYTKGKPAISTDAILIKTDWDGNLSKEAVRKNFP
ncbi:MAG: hypothetical protein K8R21_08230 [Leptospira sp.]|nr:hypothetical protein [Leptospira sp.]